MVEALSPGFLSAACFNENLKASSAFGPYLLIMSPTVSLTVFVARELCLRKMFFGCQDSVPSPKSVTAFQGFGRKVPAEVKKLFETIRLE